VGAVFTVDGSDPRMVICYMPRSTFDTAYPLYSAGAYTRPLFSST